MPKLFIFGLYDLPVFYEEQSKAKPLRSLYCNQILQSPLIRNCVSWTIFSVFSIAVVGFQASILIQLVGS